VRAFYRVIVDKPTEVVIKDVGGSTSEALWMPLAEVRALSEDELTEITAEALRKAQLI
jgi:hypothetical protein